jgi:hypothetical protein
MAVGERERRHFAVIAAAMAEEKEEQRHEVSATTAAERVRTGFLLGAVPRTPAIETALDDRAEAQIGLAHAARRLKR